MLEKSYQRYTIITIRVSELNISFYLYIGTSTLCLQQLEIYGKRLERHPIGL